MLDHLFARCPVLPVDPSVSLAKYSHIANTTFADAAALERAPDATSAERAALLHIRILQIVCKTVPSHPEYALPENAAIRRALAQRADACLLRLEAHAAALARAAARDSSPPPRDPSSSLPASAPAPSLLPLSDTSAPPARPLYIAPALLALAERIAVPTALRGEETIAVFAGRIVDRPEPALHATAIIIPSQAAAPDTSEAELLYERDVVALLDAKGLVHLGWIRVRPPGVSAEVKLGPHALRLHSRCAEAVPEAATCVILPRIERDMPVRVVWLADANLGRVELQEDDEDELDGSDVPPISETAMEDPTVTVRLAKSMSRARHVVFSTRKGPPYKLYDLRPMAAVHAAKAKSRARAQADARGD